MLYILLEKSGQLTPERLKRLSQTEKQHPVVGLTGDESKAWCCKDCIEPGMLGPCQGKLEVVKQEMARVNIDISGINELKWTRMGEFNSDDHYIYYDGKESLRRSGVALIVK